MSKQFSHATTCLYTISWIRLSMLPYRAEKKEKEKKKKKRKNPSINVIKLKTLKWDS